MLCGRVELRIAATTAFVPRGPGFDPQPLKRYPVRALRGGEDGIAVTFAWKAGKVGVQVLARGACDAETVEWAIGLARGISGVDDDPSEFVRSVLGHPILGRLARRMDARLGRSPTLFEAYAIAVIEQLVTTWEAREAIKRLWWIAGEPIPGTKLRAAPTASGVRSVPMWKLRAIGVGSRRAAALRQGTLRGAQLEALRERPGAEVVEKLQSLRGVGPWTANRVARMACGYADAVPVGDLHAPRFVSHALTGEEGDDDAMLAALEPFRPHRARVVKLIEEGVSSRRDPTSGRPRRLPKVDKHRREPWAF
jgi:3-methyladenine DNA glycosylase/8-oxoguanine DNA glycosylase